MNRCRECGAVIEDIQARNFNNLCPSCVRIRKSSAPLQTIAKKQAEQWLGLVVIGFMILIITTFLLVAFEGGGPQPMVFLLGYIIGGGFMIVGYILYKGSQS